jgi:hypothetical protein
MIFSVHAEHRRNSCSWSDDTAIWPALLEWLRVVKLVLVFDFADLTALDLSSASLLRD